MLHLPCTYCGKRLTADESWVGTNVKCPGCGHIFHIPKKRIEPPNYKSQAPIKQDEAFWDKKSDEQIAQILLPKQEGPDETELAVEKHRWRFLIPCYDDLTLFTFSVTFLLLLALNVDLREDITKLLIFAQHRDPRAFGIPAIIVAGMALSFVNIFIEREKTNLEKYILLYFAIVLTAGTSAYAGYIMFNDKARWLMLFPFLNFANAGLLIILLRVRLIDIDCITDDHANLYETAFSLLAILVLVLICRYLFKLHWVYTYSIAVCYTTSLHSVIADYFPRWPGNKD